MCDRFSKLPANLSATSSAMVVGVHVGDGVDVNEEAEADLGVGDTLATHDQGTPHPPYVQGPGNALPKIYNL